MGFSDSRVEVTTKVKPERGETTAIAKVATVHLSPSEKGLREAMKAVVSLTAEEEEVAATVVAEAAIAEAEAAIAEAEEEVTMKVVNTPLASLHVVAEEREERVVQDPRTCSLLKTSLLLLEPCCFAWRVLR